MSVLKTAQPKCKLLTSMAIAVDLKYNSIFTRLLHQHGLISILNVINSLAYAFYILNYSSFVMFANTINRETSITLECVEQQKNQ